MIFLTAPNWQERVDGSGVEFTAANIVTTGEKIGQPVVRLQSENGRSQFSLSRVGKNRLGHC
jgi:hypothetical protein